MFMGVFYITLLYQNICTDTRFIYTYQRGLLRCSFYWMGQCESLETRDE